MLLTLTQFQALPYIDQLEALLREGIYLAMRYEQAEMINLYALGSFLVEVFYNLRTNQLHRCHGFRSTDGLENYLTAMWRSTSAYRNLRVHLKSIPTHGDYLPRGVAAAPASGQLGHCLPPSTREHPARRLVSVESSTHGV